MSRFNLSLKATTTVKDEEISKQESVVAKKLEHIQRLISEYSEQFNKLTDMVGFNLNKQYPYSFAGEMVQVLDYNLTFLYDGNQWVSITPQQTFTVGDKDELLKSY